MVPWSQMKALLTELCEEWFGEDWSYKQTVRWQTQWSMRNPNMGVWIKVQNVHAIFRWWKAKGLSEHHTWGKVSSGWHHASSGLGYWVVTNQARIREKSAELPRQCQWFLPSAAQTPREPQPKEKSVMPGWGWAHQQGLGKESCGHGKNWWGTTCKERQ